MFDIFVAKITIYIIDGVKVNMVKIALRISISVREFRIFETKNTKKASIQGALVAIQNKFQHLEQQRISTRLRIKFILDTLAH